jgi:pyruvate dehydrogenase E2 component (dihydrolipoamide acetyltransferase)
MPYLDILIPDELGEVEEYVVVTWLKRVGDRVKKDEIMLVLQAAKVAYDFPAPADGKVVEILTQQGDVVNKQQVLARLEVGKAEDVESSPQGEQAAPPTPESPQVKATPVAMRMAADHGVNLDLVSGSGPNGWITEKDVQAYLESSPKAPGKTAEVLSSPLAKRVARENQVDLTQVTGSGEGGRISEKDVLAYLEAQKARPPKKREPPKLQGQPAAREIPFTGPRALIAKRMLESIQGMAQLTLHTEADVTELIGLRESLKQQYPLTYTDLIVRACALALEQHPHINATLDGDCIRILPEIHIGLAVALEDGLIVPVIPNANRLNLQEIAEVRGRLVERARSGKLTPAEYNGGTFTVTNLGTYDIDGFTPIINPPEAAVLGVGRIIEKVVVHNGKVAQRAMITLSLTIDHRIVDGAPGAAFLKTVKQVLETPEQLR